MVALTLTFILLNEIKKSSVTTFSQLLKLGKAKLFVVVVVLLVISYCPRFLLFFFKWVKDQKLNYLLTCKYVNPPLNPKLYFIIIMYNGVIKHVVIYVLNEILLELKGPHT